MENAEEQKKEKIDYSLKTPNDDPSLKLIGAPKINKKLIRLVMLGIGSVFLIGLIIGLQPGTITSNEALQDAKDGIIIRPPSELAIDESDYYTPPAEEPKLPEELTSQDGRTDIPGYQTYDRSPPQRTVDAVPAAVRQNDGGGYGTGKERRSLFYGAAALAVQQPSHVPPQNQTYSPSQGGANAAAMIENAYASDYQKQNMNALKTEFLEAAQKQDFSGYLRTLAIPSVDPTHEIKTGTSIPITLIYAIHSDLPGPIEAQVTENVYDTITGNNVLIPRGTRAHGEYSSSVAFGQERVLVAWNRLTLPDGLSVNLQGMQGVDLKGMAGLADQVDHHIDNILLAVGLSTVWDIAKFTTLSALSTTRFLKDLSDALTASGSTFETGTEATQAIVQNYANKLLNQQPTITIRAGTVGHIYVSKDMILPTFNNYR
jgi:type IV secretion system protein VirB10